MPNGPHGGPRRERLEDDLEPSDEDLEPLDDDRGPSEDDRDPPDGPRDLLEREPSVGSLRE